MDSGDPTALTAQVRELYQRYPYPSSATDAALVYDLVAILDLALDLPREATANILDVGCGSGHRLVPVALRFPCARVTGIDIAAEPLTVAANLAARHGATNLVFRQGAIGTTSLEHAPDVILANGVLHHLEDTEKGLCWLGSQLSERGLLVAWVYDALGEFDRMADREMVRLLSADDPPARQEQILRALGLRCREDRYGASPATADDPEPAALARDADAYLHPCVTPWRVTELAERLGRAGFTWAAVLGFTAPGRSMLLDAADARGLRPPFLDPATLFTSPPLRDAFAALDPWKRLAALELGIRPTGFSFAAGRGQMPDLCSSHLRGLALAIPCT